MSAKLRESSTLLPQTLEEPDNILVKMEEEEACNLDSSLHWKSCYSLETFYQHFRQFGYQESPGPREAQNQLRELCCQWLRPEVYTKKQIQQLIMLEQFLAILPEELQARLQELQPENREEADLTPFFYSLMLLFYYMNMPKFLFNLFLLKYCCHAILY